MLFGLSMDYHVFLLSRIRERYDQTSDNSESVAFGVRSTAGLITGAALIMVAVFSGFAAGSLVPLQQMGFGLAVAVFLDATIVRVVLVPASMQLLGDRNWYLPSFLEWLPRHPRRGRPANARARARPHRRRSGPDARRLASNLAPSPASPPLRRCPTGGGLATTALDTLWLRPRRRTHVSRETSQRGGAPHVW